MINVISNKTMGNSHHGWLNSIFHFSFAEYYNPNNMHFGPLRVVNDDLINSLSGFDTHPHENMEIISYVIDGHLTHGDSMGNQQTLSRGHIQYMSAGTGITHSEHNLGDKTARFLQIWIMPDKKDHLPQYGDHRFIWQDRVNQWLTVASGNKNIAPITIHQDVTISVLYLEAGNALSYELASNRKAYLIQIEGTSQVNGLVINEKDAAEITNETSLTLLASTDSHYIIFDMSA